MSDWLQAITFISSHFVYLYLLNLVTDVVKVIYFKKSGGGSLEHGNHWVVKVFKEEIDSYYRLLAGIEFEVAQ